ncbi:MAG: radical SAM protein [Planctomycetota bacterium]|jgi:MoaA/NifB/PqqE/SkfB family radical SAM enzyme
MAWMKTLEAATKLPRLLVRGEFPFRYQGVPLMVKHTPLSRRLNALKCALSSALKTDRALGLPPGIQLEPTNTCNLKCPLCPTGTGTLKRRRGFMSAETFDRVMDELGEALMSITFYGWGEPFLHPRLPKMIAACTERDILTVTSTNGHCLQTLDEAVEVVDAGLSAVFIALDGSTQEIFATYRKSGHVEKVKRCAAMLEEAKARRNSSRPCTVIRAVATRDNEDDLGNIERVAREIGVNMFSYKSVAGLSVGAELSPYEATHRDLQRYEYRGDERLQKEPIMCPYPFRQPTILWDGTVTGCECDYEMVMPLGRLGERPFTEIWNGAAARALRRAIRQRRGRPSFCARCPYQDRVQESCELFWTELRPPRRPEP